MIYKAQRYIELTAHCVGSGSCHNGCILNVFDQVVHGGPLFFPSASSATGSVLDWSIGHNEVGIGFVLVYESSCVGTDGTEFLYSHKLLYRFYNDT